MTGYPQGLSHPSGPAHFAAGILRSAAAPEDLIRLGAAVACAIAASMLAASAPVALKCLIESLSPGGLSGRQAGAEILPVVWLAAYIGALLTGRVTGEVRGVLFGAAEQSIARKLGRRAFAHVLALPMKAHRRHSTGGLVQTLENGLQGYRLILQHGLFTILPGLIEIAMIAALLVHFLDPVFLLVFAGCAAASTLVFADGAWRVLRASAAVSTARIDANARLSDGLLNFETVKAFCGEDTITQRYDARLAETQVRWGAFYGARCANGLLVALVFCAGLGVTLWLAAAGVRAGTMTLGELVLINAWMIQIVRPLEQLGIGIRDIGQGLAFVEQLNGLLRETPEAQSGIGPQPVPRSDQPLSIRFENVSFSYGDGQKALDDVSFDIEAGKVTALVGPSGSGKSSIIRLLMRFYEPDTGRITINGADIRNHSPREVRRMMALVSQDVALFNDSVAFNITFPEEDGTSRAVEWAASRVELEDLASKRPDGFGTIAGERGLTLSGGERQRVAIARALLRRARIFLADEATSAVDDRTGSLMAMNGVLSEAGVTTLIVAHRLATVARADEIIVLDQGRVVERGRHAELCVSGGFYANAWREQMAK